MTNLLLILATNRAVNTCDKRISLSQLKRAQNYYQRVLTEFPIFINKMPLIISDTVPYDRLGKLTLLRLIVGTTTEVQGG